MLFSKRFFGLFITQFLGAFNDNFFKNALVILVAYQSVSVLGFSSEQLVTLSGGIFILPFFLFSSLAGQLSDLKDKAVIARWVKISEIAIMILASVGFMFHQFELLLGTLFLMGAHSTFFGPMKYSILPQHLAEDELVAGNAYIEAATFLAILLGTLVGGILISVAEIGTRLVSAGLMLIAILGYLSSRQIPPAPPLQVGRVDFNLFRGTAQLIRYSMKTRSVWLSILGISWFWCLGASVLSLIPTIAKEVIGGSEGVVTLLLTTFSVGIGVGSLLCEKFSRHGIERGLVVLGALGLSLGVWATGYSVGYWPLTEASAGPLQVLGSTQGQWLLLSLFTLALFGGLYIVPLYALMQHDSDPKNRSQVIAGNNVMNAVFMVAGAVGLSWLQGRGVSLYSIFLCLSLLNLLVATYIFWLIPEFFFRFIVGAASHIFYRVQIEGRENLPQVKSAVVVANHVSFIDWIFVSAALNQPVRFVVDAAYCRGFVGWLMIRLGKTIPILTARESKAVLIDAFKKVDEEINEGAWICIFPEGVLTGDGSLNVFKSGASRIVEKNVIPVVPIGIEGLWGSWFSRKGGKAIFKLPRRFRAGIRIRIGKTIDPSSATPETLRAAVSQLLTHSY